MTVEELLSEHRPKIASISTGLRQIMLDLLPEAEERVYPGWHGIGYVDPELGYIGAIFPQADEVRLGFEHGYTLNDPDGLLIRPGTRVAYLSYRTLDSIDRETIEDFMAQLGVLQD